MLIIVQPRFVTRRGHVQFKILECLKIIYGNTGDPGFLPTSRYTLKASASWHSKSSVLEHTVPHKQWVG